MGYDPNIIQGSQIPVPILGERTRASAFDNGALIDHHRYSVVFNSERGFAIFTAHNIDGATIIPSGVIPRKDRFRLDPDVPSNLQVDNDRGYVNNPWDRGHLVRRRALHWGDQGDAEKADNESYFWTNIAPQHEKLQDSAWGKIENWMLDFADNNDKQACVFTGPVYALDDPEFQNRPDEVPIKIPAGFWKVFVIKRRTDIRTAGFLVWQRDFDKPEPETFDPVLEQVRITTIEFLAGLSFGNLRDADPLHFGVKAGDFAGSSSLLNGARTPWSALITSPEDIAI